MREKVEYAIEKLEDGFLRLKEGLSSAEDELEMDGVIQRFEFTFELFWKALKIFLEYQGIEAKTPRDSLKEGFRIGLLDEEKVYLDMLEDRNLTSHIYDKETVEEVFKRIKAEYGKTIEKVLNNLKRRIE
ncbi:nucleotidyltransferase substrate binding protein [bacterium]|nr:nucleotidyltransferase substrate binding protein [bacterium]MBU1599920.1 nucleotidyltransferase substrate binding protein [bacterium]MBU2461255.1 nucleotidyltransferase substrate binding protein [bacterium]